MYDYNNNKLLDISYNSYYKLVTYMLLMKNLRYFKNKIQYLK
jgi:hypothetical protein